MSALESVMSIASDGMRVERARLEVATQNLANAGAVRSADGRVYQPSRVVSYMRGSNDSPGFNLEFGRGPTFEIVQEAVQSRLVSDPNSPLADANGLVEVSAVNPATEMVEITAAVRAYEANVRSFNAARAMAVRALSIGER